MSKFKDHGPVLIPHRDQVRIVNELLKPGTPIPSKVRDEIRSFVRSRREFPHWSMGLFKSSNIPNAALIGFAREHPHVGIVVLNILTDGVARQ